MGCGILLVEAFKFLCASLKDYYRNNPDRIGNQNKKSPHALLLPDGRIKLSTTLKRKVLECLYGVDIDLQAIEIAAMWIYIHMMGDKDYNKWDRKRIRQYMLRESKNNAPRINILNFIEANAIVEPDYDGPDHESSKSFNWYGSNPIGRVMNNGGFDAVMVNPPYRWCHKFCVNTFFL